MARANANIPINAWKAKKTTTMVSQVYGGSKSIVRTAKLIDLLYSSIRELTYISPPFFIDIICYFTQMMLADRYN